MATIGEASRRSGVKIETIRYYEREGVTPAPDRTATGRRVYTENGVSVLVFVKRCRDMGFSLSDARALLALRNATDDQCDEVRSISERHIADVRNRIVALRQLEAALEALVSECRKGHTACPALEELFTG
ncbi:MAG: MerR family transcriptional regulator [Alphaproteobacteria bacterium]